MSKLELKVPPVLLMAIFALIMWLLSLFSPTTPVFFGWGLFIAIGFIVAGISLFILGGVSFSKEKTTVNPTMPDASSALVTSGIYSITRNPMYIGALLILIGHGVFLSNLYTLVLLVGFVLYMNKFQIIPEERALEARFGESFIAYKKKVRRWL